MDPFYTLKNAEMSFRPSSGHPSDLSENSISIMSWLKYFSRSSFHVVQTQFRASQGHFLGIKSLEALKELEAVFGVMVVSVCLVYLNINLLNYIDEALMRGFSIPSVQVTDLLSASANINNNIIIITNNNSNNNTNIINNNNNSVRIS